MTSLARKKIDIIGETEKPMSKKPVADRSSVTGFFSLHYIGKNDFDRFLSEENRKTFSKNKTTYLRSNVTEGGNDA